MDDLILSVDNENTARIYRDIYRVASNIVSTASMTLRKWNSNANVRQCFAEEDGFPEAQKVLGLRWVVTTDELEVDLDSVLSLLNSEGIQGTKRSILRIMARIFDPIGVLAPWTVRLKILFQNIWRRKLSWDENLPTDLQGTWTICRSELNELNDIAIPRYFKSNAHSTQLHIFADASQFAFGAVAYARTYQSNENVSVQFICAKGRVAPLKSDNQSELTIPKLELTAALIATRLFVYLCDNLPIKFNDVFLWTDSQITLYWILGTEKRWKPYVENRVKEIRALSDASSWRHCPGCENPADRLTRGISAISLKGSFFWMNGPSWLQEEHIHWPTSLKSDVTLCALSSYAEQDEIGNAEDPASPPNLPVLRNENFSTWRRLLRGTAFVLRAVGAFKYKRRFTEYLSAEETNDAETYWVNEVQWQHFSKEIMALRQGKGMPSNSKLLSLSPILGFVGKHLRVGGRLQNVVVD